MLKFKLKESIYEILGSNPGNNCALIRDSKKIYLINSNALYLSNETNLNTWTYVKSLNYSLNLHTSKPVTRKRDVFLLSSYANQIWNFNLDSLDIKLIVTIW